ncbi:MAG: hypothetical protein JRD93_17990 [Deltaproteobacteria bacterium]|nr:hypothetical protein [Deltaproteobacteria bacterium]
MVFRKTSVLLTRVERLQERREKTRKKVVSHENYTGDSAEKTETVE